jgi:hypothetical protein
VVPGEVQLSGVEYVPGTGQLCKNSMTARAPSAAWANPPMFEAINLDSRPVAARPP